MYADNPNLKGRVSEAEEKVIGTKVFDVMPEVFFDEKPITGEFACIYGRKNEGRIIKWSKREYYSNHPDFDKWKVFLTKSSGSGTLGEILSKPVLGEPGSGATQTFISFGNFGSKKEAQNCLKYIQSKFCRIMLGTLNVTQHNPKNTWRNVPL